MHKAPIAKAAAPVRQTKQKEAIRNVVEAAGRPLSPEEIRSAAERTVKRISLATVYRNLTTLTKDKWLQPVLCPGMPARYELASKPHHHHFHCDRCDRMFDLDGCGLDYKANVPKGFQVRAHEFFLSGVCASCR